MLTDLISQAIKMVFFFVHIYDSSCDWNHLCNHKHRYAKLATAHFKLLDYDGI